MHVPHGRDGVADPFGERHAHHTEDQYGDREHDDHECAEPERGTIDLRDEPEGPGVNELADPHREPATATAGTGDGDGGERQQRQCILSEHPARADGQAVRLVFELPRGPYRADEGMPA